MLINHVLAQILIVFERSLAPITSGFFVDDRSEAMFLHQMDLNKFVAEQLLAADDADLKQKRENNIDQTVQTT